MDDSAQVMLALSRVKTSNESYHTKSVERAIDWILSMQCKNGGWASFDKDNDRMVFQHIPFADHNAMLDPPTVDITGRVLECLATYGYSLKDAPVRRAVEFLKREQEPDGSWFGRWGVNYIYGTMLVLRGLEAVGVDHHEPCVQQAAEWLRMMQNPDGGWGETCGSYDDPNTKGVGPSTASQTAWAVMGLLAANDTRSDSLQRGIAYLLKTQRKRRLLGRAVVHGHRLSARVLPRVLHVPAVLPAAGVDDVYQSDFGIGGRAPASVVIGK